MPGYFFDMMNQAVAFDDGLDRYHEQRGGWLETVTK